MDDTSELVTALMRENPFGYDWKIESISSDQNLSNLLSPLLGVHNV